MEVKYCSDSHLYEVTSLDWRKNQDLDDYANNLLRNWNSDVGDSDRVYLVGDIGRLCPQTCDILRQLNGEKILIIGNHDLEWVTINRDFHIFDDVFEAVYQDNVLVVHEPSNAAKYMRQGIDFVVHGHHHQYSASNMRKELLKYYGDVHRYNCCLDLNRNKPCTLQELMTNKAVMLDRMGLV